MCDLEPFSKIRHILVCMKMIYCFYPHIVPPLINRSLGLTNNNSINLHEINVGENPFVLVPFNITNVILYCVVSGREMPTVNWTTPPLDNDTFSIETSVEMDGLLYVVTSLFNISNFTNDYAGIYRCNASNCAGQDGIGINTTQQGNNTIYKHITMCTI